MSSPYRTQAPKPPKKEYVLEVAIWFTSGTNIKFEVDFDHNYQLTTNLKRLHERFVDKWEPEKVYGDRVHMRDCGLIFKKDGKDFVVNLKHVAFYSIEAIPFAEPQA